MSVEVSDWNELDAMREDLEGEYILVNDLTPETDGYDDKASETANPLNDEGSWSSGTSYEFEDLVEHNGASYYCIKEHTSDSDSEPDEGEYWDDYWAETDKEAGDCLGWRPIGEGTDDVYRFSGVFDGDVHTIKGLTIDREDEVTVGLFSRTKSGSYGSTIGVFKNTLFEDVDIKGGSRTGTMVGRCGYRGQAFVEYVGVLSGTVEGEDRVGGITGNSSSSGTRIRHCFNFADIIGEDKVGGIVGRISANDSQANKNYSHGSVTGDTYVGGFNGQIHCMSDSNYNYATGEVNGNNNVGGITGYSRVSSDIDDSYWDTETTNQSSSACSSTGRTTSEMTGSSALTYMDDFDFSEDYHIVESDEEIAHGIIPSVDGYPILRPDSGWTTEQEEKWIEEQLKETPDVQTKPADNITTNSATLHGELTDLGTAGEVDVWFEYWEKVGEYTFEGSSEEDSDPETLTEPDTFDADLTDLEPDTEYEFRAVADGYGDVQYGDILSFTTLETYTLNVLPATNIGQNSATLNADVVTLGQYDSADIVFRVWEEPEVTAESGWGLMANEFVGVGGTEVEVITETGWDWDMSGDFMRVQGQLGYPFYTIKNVEDLGDDKYRIEIEEEFKLAIGGPQELIETLTESTDHVRGVAFGDGFIAYGGWDDNVYVHNTDDFSLETTLTEATDNVNSVAFGDGFLAVGSSDNDVYVYDTSDFSLETTLTESTSTVRGVAFGDGFIAYGGADNNVYVHDTSDFSLETTLTEASGTVWGVAFTDGFIAYGGFGNNVYVHDTSDFSLETTLTEATDRVNSVAFGDGFIAYASNDDNVYVHNTDDFDLETTLTEATASVRGVAFTDGFIAYGVFDENVYVHDTSDFSLETTLTEATDRVNSVAFGDGFIAYGGYDENVYVHELEEFGDRIRIYDGLESDLQTITEEGQVQQNVSGLDKHTTYQYRIISYANDDIIHTFESAESPEYMEEQFTTGLLVSTTEPELYEDMAVLRGELEDLGYHDDADVWFEYSEDIYEALDFDHGVYFVDYSPDGQYVAISSDNIYIHETNEWTEVKEISGDGNAVWSPDNQYLAHEDGENVIIRDANDLDNIVETLGGIDEEYSLDINAISWSEDSNYISFGGIEGFERPLYIYKTSDWSLAERILDAQQAIRDISWSDDGQYVASANESGNVLIHVVGEWTLETTISEGGVAYTVDWSPGSDMIMHGTSDYVYIHNSSDWSLEETLTELDGHALSVKWSPDGEFVVYGGGFDFNVYIHRTRNWSLVDILTDATDHVWTVSYTDGYILYGSEENKLHITGSRKKTPDETIDYEGEFEYEIHDLEKRSSFKYDANAESDDDMVSGELVYFTLPIIETVDVSSFLNSINSMVDYMVQFGWRTTDPQTVTEPGDYSDLIEGLQPGSEYEFKAVAENETNVYDEGQVLTFMTNFYEAVSSFLGSSGSNIISRLSSVSKSACSLFKSITDFNFVFGRRVTSSIDTLTTIAEKIESTLKRSKTFVDNILSETYGAVRVVVIVKKFIDASRSISSRVKKVKRRVVSDLNNLLSLPKKSSINEFLIKHKVDPLTSNIIRYVDKIYEFAHYFDKILTETDGDYRSVTYVFVYVGKSVTSVSTLRNIKRSVISQSYDILSSINKMSILTKNTISYVKNITSDSQIVFRVSAYIKSCLSTGKLSFLITNISHIKNFVTSSIYDIPVSTSFLNAFASNVPSIIVKFRTVVSQAFDINSSSKRLIKIENKVISSVSKIITLSERMFYAFASTTSFSNTIVSLKASVFDKIRHVISVYHDNKTISKIKPRMVVRGFMRKFVSKSFLICLDPYQISISVEKRRYQKGKIIPINIRIYDQLGNPRNSLYKFSEDIKTKSESFIKKILSDK